MKAIETLWLSEGVRASEILLHKSTRFQPNPSFIADHQTLCLNVETKLSLIAAPPLTAREPELQRILNSAHAVALLSENPDKLVDFINEWLHPTYSWAV